MPQEREIKQNIAFATHPEYRQKHENWVKFRRVMEGGSEFKRHYLEPKPGEQKSAFELRKRTTSVPAFAKSAVKKVRNAIYQRLDGVRRHGGSKKFEQAVAGKLGGVDLRGSTLEYFMGHEVLPELLALGKVGIFVDSPNLFGERRTIRDNEKLHPYLYTYRAEDIRNWEFFMKDEELQFRKLLLRVRRENFDPTYNLVHDTTEQFRLFEVDDFGNVWVQFFNREGAPIDASGMVLPHTMPQQMDVDRIPMVLLELENSLLEDTADHQIALLNMESFDINYCLRANSPYYTEQYDPAFDMVWNRGPAQANLNDETFLDENGTEVTGDNSNPDDVKLGTTDGRRYGKGLERPNFIAPPSDPMRASMEKQQQLKDDIDRLLDLATLSTRSRYASAESKGFDERGLDSGLSAIGLILENAERGIGKIWNVYEGGPQITTKYPERYSLKSDDDRRKDAKSLVELFSEVSSPTFRKAGQRELAEIIFGGKIDDDELATIFREIEETKYPTSNIEQIRADVEVGLVSRETGSLARGWPEGEAEKAAEERAEREAKMAAAQGVTKNDNMSARGLDDNPEGAKQEKEESQNPDNNPDGVKKVRGEGK